MRKRKTLRFDRLDLDTFNDYFGLDSFGWRLAMEADAAGELGTALDKLETVCLLNKLVTMNLQNRIMRELLPFGKDKAQRYLELGHDERAEYAVSILGKEETKQILKDVVAETRAEAHIGENDKKGG
jgi:hypothetical protein